MNLPGDPYDLNQFFIKSTDERGHGNKIQARIPPDLARIVEIIVASKRFPYQTSSDLLRDSIWRLAGLLAPKVDSYELTTIMAQLSASEELLKPVEAGEKLMKVLDNLGLRLMALDSNDERKKLVGKIKEELERVREPYWKERALRTLKERYGEYFVRES